MSIDVNISDGSGSIGDIVPGWSVNEYATPLTIGDSAAGTGSVSFNAKANDDSLFIINNNVTTTEETFGSISGIIKTVSQSGINVSVMHDTPLSIFDATAAVIPPLYAGSTNTALDLCNQLSGRQKLLTNGDGFFYSLQGHCAGFDSSGALATISESIGTYLEYSSGTNYPVSYYQETGSIFANGFGYVDGKLYASNVYGDVFANPIEASISRLAFKAMPTSNISVEFSGLPQHTPSELYKLESYINIDISAETLEVAFKEYIGASTISDVESISSLNLDEEIAVFITYNKPLDFGDFILSAIVCNTSDYSTQVVASVTVAYPVPQYNSQWIITGLARSIYRSDGTDSINWGEEYEAPITYIATGDTALNGPVSSLANYNMWQYLQDACAAYSKEIAVVNNVITIRNTGQNIVDITNVVGAPTITPTTTFTGRSTSITYTSGVASSEFEIYNARNDNNRVISVNADQSTTTTVAVDADIAYLKILSPDSIPVAGYGEYTISDSNGANVPNNLWRYWGGSVKVKISATATNSIDIIFKAPLSNTGGVFDGATPLYPGPWKLAYSSGDADYAALSVVGGGIKHTKNTLELASGADWNKTSQQVAKSVDNKFIASLEQAYDRGILLSNDASGPRITLSGGLPASVFTGFGLCAGSLIYYRDNIYRITDVNIGNISVTFNAVRHITVGNIDTIWSGALLGLCDNTWLGYDLTDQAIAPLFRVGDDESVIMLLDTDVNPYYDVTGDPEISVFHDSDYNPYYIDGGNIDGESDVYLDTDGNPYDGG